MPLSHGLAGPSNGFHKVSHSAAADACGQWPKQDGNYHHRHDDAQENDDDGVQIIVTSFDQNSFQKTPTTSQFVLKQLPSLLEMS